jgi:hypothetical protein
MENEGIEYPVAAPSRMMINRYNELNEDQKQMFKEELKKASYSGTNGRALRKP